MSEASIDDARPLSQFLRMAVMAGVESAVRIHIERGDDLNSRDASGMTPLMLSAARNKPTICKLLLEAGADYKMLDPSGKNALEIAIAAGSEATAAILKADCSPVQSSRVASTINSEPNSTIGLSSLLDHISIGHEPSESEKATEPHELESQPTVSDSKPGPPPSLVINEIDDGEFDLSVWEAEEEPARPEADLMVLDLATAVQTAITAHEPIDSSAEWDDIDLYLPEVALPLALADDADGRAQLRGLLLRAIREGSVPKLAVQAQSTNEDCSENPAAEAYLSMVINDLGAEVDERFEYSDAHESFKVFIDPAETLDEETTLDDALVAIDNAASLRYEPLRIYQREFQRHQLLTAEQEIQLAKDMEAALDKALDALAGWPDGIKRTLAAGTEAIAGLRQLSSIWVGGTQSDLDPTSTDSREAGTSSGEKLESTIDEESPQEEATINAGNGNFADLLQQLAALIGTNAVPSASHEEIRDALAALCINRRFLLELIDAAQPCPGFLHAMADFRKSRDCMTAANLKLSFFHARKYLNSGEPLDDLAQEGNIGLLKAVDRYDWRRGFRFSTYATWWIRQQIGRYLADKIRTIRVPVHIHEKLQRAERISQAFEATAGRKPTLDELAARVEMPIQKLSTLMNIASEPSTIDDATVDGLIASDARDAYMSSDPADIVNEIQLKHAVDCFISSLPSNDRKADRILRMRFGIGTNDPLTLDEIGSRLEVTRERIRQIEAKTLRKLRHRSRSEPFARMALGMQSKDNSGAPNICTPEEDDTHDATDTTPKPVTLDLILAQAAELGVPVIDGRETPSGRIWVKLLAEPEHAHSMLVRKLIEFGFEHSPAKGYWK